MTDAQFTVLLVTVTFYGFFNIAMTAVWAVRILKAIERSKP